MATLPVYDYKKIKKEDIHAFMVENATAEEKADFKAKAFESKKQKTRVPVYIPGTTEPVIVRRKDKKTGQYKLMPKMEWWMLRTPPQNPPITTVKPWRGSWQSMTA